MQRYYLDMEGIPEYINAVEDAQNQCKYSGNSITAATLLLISTNAMLCTKRSPHTDESWEDLSKEMKDWDAWKTLYKSSDQKAKVKNKAVSGQGQFGAAHGTFKQSLPPQQENGRTMSAHDLNKYFEALAKAITTDMGVLEELARVNATLTATND